MTGRRILRADAVGTLALAVSSALAVVSDGWPRPVHVAVSLSLFALGCVAFLWSYGVALQRSRTAQIGVASLYLLTGGTAPHPARLRMTALLVAQVAVAVGAASLRPFTTLAFGILAPVFGLGLNGLWAARHGRFAPRQAAVAPPVPPSSGS